MNAMSCQCRHGYAREKSTGLNKWGSFHTCPFSRLLEAGSWFISSLGQFFQGSFFPLDMKAWFLHTLLLDKQVAKKILKQYYQYQDSKRQIKYISITETP